MAKNFYNSGLRDLWFQAWVAYSCDNGVDVRGNEQCASSVIATLEEVIERMGWPMQVRPSRDRLIEWMEDNNMADMVEYLMEE